MATAPALGLPSTPTRAASSVAGGSTHTPTSTLSPLASSSTTTNHADAQRRSFLGSSISGSTSWTLTRTLTQPLSVRADPALLTCFDPADKELYELWAPKR
ncbi:hypothetical protein Agabi119p4_4365 [Agaricus bisporus var. burnettii]|uniref:Uncharacterized protein n=1 Tax=Agaricus bisporus var. burnettii TaxID=192524 RepID=A0A8H7F355_AGABI|nr:hypothetical protein Agabi119p4_4365 [Agaricus bisporus var. burnettii]